MGKRLRPKLTYSNAIASLALFVALGGAAVAAGLPRNSVGPRQLKREAVNAAKLKRGAVNAAKIRRAAVTAGKLAPKSVIAGKLGRNAVIADNLGKGVVNTEKIAGGGVRAVNIKNGVVTTNKLHKQAVTTARLGKESVTTAKLGKESVTSGKLGPEVAPLLGALRSGQTLRGIFDLGGDAGELRDAESYQFPLVSTPAAPEVNILSPEAPTAACPGLSGSLKQTPQAAAGQLCVYVTGKSPEFESLAFDSEASNRLGFALVAKFEGAAAGNFVQGQWAVTAP